MLEQQKNKISYNVLKKLNKNGPQTLLVKDKKSLNKSMKIILIKSQPMDQKNYIAEQVYLILNG